MSSSLPAKHSEAMSTKRTRGLAPMTREKKPVVRHMSWEQLSELNTKAIETGYERQLNTDFVGRLDRNALYCISGNMIVADNTLRATIVLEKSGMTAELDMRVKDFFFYTQLEAE